MKQVSTEWSYNKLPTKYKYQLQQDYVVKTSIKPGKRIVTSPIPFIILEIDGTLIIKSGYCWDGPSGPTIDGTDFMRGSLVHDALYQLMRDGYIKKSNRKKSDKILKNICIEDGMSKRYASIIYRAVRIGGGFALNEKEKTIKLKVPLK